MKDLYLDTCDAHKLYVAVWDEVEKPIKGTVLIAHGMAEHIGRYDDFARFLNDNGYVVIGEDERGHRNSTPTRGVVQGDSFNQSIEDKKMLVAYIRKNYEGKVILLGHSYGSFVSQGFLELYADMLDGCVLSGTSHMKNLLTTLALGISTFQSSIFEADKPAKLIDKMSFGAYAKGFDEDTSFCWLSRDPETVRKYEEDPDCGFVMSLGFFHSFFKGINRLYGEKLDSIPKTLPIMIAVGSEDPVSSKTKNAEKLFYLYRDHGLNVKYRVYPGARHEILNETNRQDVYQDILDFIDECLVK